MHHLSHAHDERQQALQAIHLGKVLGEDALAPEQAAVQALGRVANVARMHQHLQRPLPLLLRPPLQIAAELPDRSRKVLHPMINVRRPDMPEVHQVPCRHSDKCTKSDWPCSMHCCLSMGLSKRAAGALLS